jgi:hypothetical protein
MRTIFVVMKETDRSRSRRPGLSGLARRGGRVECELFTVPNSGVMNQMSLPVDPVNGSVFYHLACPWGWRSHIL